MPSIVQVDSVGTTYCMKETRQLHFIHSNIYPTHAPSSLSSFYPQLFLIISRYFSCSGCVHTLGASFGIHRPGASATVIHALPCHCWEHLIPFYLLTPAGTCFLVNPIKLQSIMHTKMTMCIYYF